MDSLTASAASGLRARMEALEMLANNLANAATGGYKTDRESYSLYFAPEASGATAAERRVMPVIERQWTDFSQGLLRTTGNPFDLALAGKGFFAVNAPSGTLYTRNGNFSVSTKGELLTSEGYSLRLLGGGTLKVQAGKPVEIASDGTVRQEGQVAGRLEIVDFADRSVLGKMGNSYFRNTDAQAKAAAAAGAEVHQGKLESSNVGSAESAVRLVGVMRQFEMLQKALTLGAEMNRKAVEEVARVG